MCVSSIFLKEVETYSRKGLPLISMNLLLGLHFICRGLYQGTIRSISLVAPSLLQIYFDLTSEQATFKYTGGPCKALLASIQERFEGLFKQLGISVDITTNFRLTSELLANSFSLTAPFLDGRFSFRWIMCSKLRDQSKARLCETIKRL